MRQLVPAAVLAALLPGQRPAEAMSFVPEDACLVLRVQCGERWRRELGATRIGKVIADPGLRDGWAVLERMLRANVPAGLRTVVDAAPAIVDGYGGEIVLAAWIDWNAVAAAIEAQRAPPFAVLLAFGADGRTDAAALAGRIAALLPGQPRTQTLAGTDVPVHTGVHGAVTGPFVRDGCVLMLLADDLAAHAPRFLGADRRAFAAPAAFRGTLAAGAVQLGDGLERLLASAIGTGTRGAERAAARADLLGAVRVLRLPSLRRACWTLAADGPWCSQEAWLELDGADRGVFDVLFPVRDRPPALLALLPPDARGFSASHVDVAAGWALALRAWRALGPAVPLAPERLFEEFTKGTKLDLEADLVALLGDELLQVDDLAALGEIPEGDTDAAAAQAERFGDTCYALSLRDGARFARNFEQLIRSRGLHAGRKTEEHAGTKVHRLTLLGRFSLEYAVTERFLVIGVGDGAGTARNLRALLAAAAAPPREGGAALPAGFGDALAGVAPGWSSVQAVSLREVARSLQSLATQLEQVLGEAHLASDEAGAGIELLTKLAGPMQRALETHGAGLVVTTGTSAKTRMTWRTRL